MNPVSPGLRRQRKRLTTPQGPEVVCEGRQMINFCSNDYLGLANDPDIKQAFVSGVDKYGAGSGASQYICGFSEAHKELEDAVCEATGRERALCFASGYLANLAIQTCLLKKGDLAFIDRLVHASINDATVLSRADLCRYPHNDVEWLQHRLQENGEAGKLIFTDGVFSMDGDLAPLQQLTLLSEEYRALLAVDDAHGFAVLGENGLGVTEHCCVPMNKVDVYMATLGKACGTYGAFVTGSAEIIEHLLQTARTLIYTTALPPAVAVAARAGLEKALRESWRRDRLFFLVDRFRNGASESGLPMLDSETPIQPLMVYENDQAVSLSQTLFEAGVLVSAIRPPTVPEGTARLRITLSAAHTEEHVDRLIETLNIHCQH